MSLNEKSVVGAQVNLNPKSASLAPPSFITNNTSSSSLAPTFEQTSTPAGEYDATSSHPFSAFYSHPTTRTSLEQHLSESKVHIKVIEQDLEAASPHFSSLETSRNHKECAVWPCTKQMKKKSLMVQRNKGCSPLRGLPKTQRLWVKILIALVVIGAAVGIGIGISKAVGGGVWKNVNSQGQIGGPD